MKVKFNLTLLTLLLMLSTQSCYHYSIHVDQPNGTEFKTQKVNSYWWGLRQSKIEVENCEDGYIQEVYVKQNFGSNLVMFLTLGIYRPTTIMWRCGKGQTPDFPERLIIERKTITSTKK